MNKLLLFFIIIALFIRLPGLDDPFFSDEINLKTDIVNDSMMHLSPPLPVWILKLLIPISWVNTITMRLFSLIFNILTIVFVYLICRKVYDKKTAFFSVFLMAFLFYPILNSLEIADESFIVFLSILLFYFNLKFKNNLRFFLVGLTLGLILLTKYTGILIFIIFCLYELVEKGLKKSIINSILVFIIALLVFSIFPIINYDLFLYTIHHLFRSTSGETISILSKLIILILWATPLLLGLPLLSLSKFNKKDILFWIWIIVGLAFNLFYMPRGDFSRYFMIILPALVILSSKYLSRIKLIKKEIYLGLISFIIFYIIFIIFNLNARIMFTHFIENYFNGAKHMLNFMFPHSLSQGSWFGIGFYSILFMLIFSTFFFILICLNFLVAASKRIARLHLPKNSEHAQKRFAFLTFFKKYRKIFLILFISLGLSYNIFLVGEYLFHVSQPNINEIIYETVVYVKEKQLPYPIYSINKGILDYLYDYNRYPDRIKVMGYRIDDETIDEVSDKLNKGGTIVFLDFTAKLKKEELDTIKNCKLIKTFSDKGKKVGYIYECVKI